MPFRLELLNLTLYPGPQLWAAHHTGPGPWGPGGGSGGTLPCPWQQWQHRQQQVPGWLSSTFFWESF